MSLSSTKQNYVVMKALDEVSRPVELGELADRMGSLSRDMFGNGSFVYGPYPLAQVISEMSRTGDVRFVDGKMRLSERGRRELRNTEPLVKKAAE